VISPAADSFSDRRRPRFTQRRAALLLGALVFVASTAALLHQYAFDQHLSGDTCLTCVSGHALDNAIGGALAAVQILFLPAFDAGICVSARPRALPASYDARGPPLSFVI